MQVSRPSAQPSAPAMPLGKAPVRVMLLVSSLDTGGAERQVVELVRNLDPRRFDPLVCSLSDRVPLACHLPDPERQLVIVSKRWKYDVTTITRVRAVAQKHRISLIHAFLFDAEMVARVLRRVGAVPVVVASERNTDYAFGPFKSSCLRLTRSWFDVMVANSAAGRRFNAERFGVPPDRIFVIRNGVDAEQFRAVDGSAVRAAAGIPAGAPLVGMVASFKRQKRHADFFQSAKLILDTMRDAWFLCAGEPLHDNQQGAEDYHRDMRELVRTLGLEERVRFIGRRDDMPAVYSACNVTTLTSSREGTPNVLLESMACEVPVVATDIADNAVIVPDGKAGYIVPLGEPAVHAEQVARLLRDRALRASMGRNARAWVLNEFSTAALARRTEDVYNTALQQLTVDQTPGIEDRWS